MVKAFAQEKNMCDKGKVLDYPIWFLCIFNRANHNPRTQFIPLLVDIQTPMALRQLQKEVALI